MEELLDKMKLREFFEVYKVTYSILTLEFLLTLRVEKDYSPSFRLCNEEITLTLDQLGENKKCPYSISFQSSDRLNLESWAHNFVIQKFMVNGVIH